MSENEISKSKQKRIEIENARKEQHRKRNVSRLITILSFAAIIALVGISYLVYQRNKANNGGILSPESYSQYLTEEGLIENIAPADYIQFDYKSLSYNKAELLPDESEIDADIASACESNATLSTDSELMTASENKISLSYTATIDSVSYNAVQEEDYTIGSAYVSEQFDNLLQGHKAGDHFQAEITYPADDANTDVAGKTISYDITIHGIYVVPEFTDEFVAENFGTIASTAEGYRDYLTQEYFRKNLKDAITDSLTNECTVLQYPEDYVANAEKIILSQNVQQFNYYNQMFYSSLGYNAYSSPYEMYGYSSDEEYRAYIHTLAQNQTALQLSVMTVFADAGLTNSREEVMDYYYGQGYDDASFQELAAQYGFNFLAQDALNDKVINYLADTVTIIEQ